MTRVKKGVLVLAVLVPVPLLVALELFVGISNLIRNLMPDPDFNSPEMVREREKVKEAIHAAFVVLDAGTGFTRHAVSTHDRCFEGQDHAKRKRNFDHSCRFRVTHFYGMNGEFAAQMIEFDTLLNANGWTPAGSATLRQVVTPADDVPPGENIPPVPDPKIIPQGYRKSSLALYMVYADERMLSYANEQTITIDKLEGDMFLVDGYNDPQDAAFETVFETYDKEHVTYEKRDFHNVRALYQEIIRSHPYVFAISIQGTYFEKPR